MLWTRAASSTPHPHPPGTLQTGLPGSFRRLLLYLPQLLLSPDSVQLTVASVMKEVAVVEGSGGARDGQGRKVWKKRRW